MLCADKGADAMPDDERQFLADYDPANFERPSLAVDVVLVGIRNEALATVLVRRNEHPQRGRWALPGGFLRMTESLEACAVRVLREKAGVAGVFLEQLYTFGALKRDPRTRIVSVAYYALVPPATFARIRPEDVAHARIEVAWPGETGGPAALIDDAGRTLPVAFDHATIVGTAVKRIRGKLDYAPIGYELLAPEFSLLDLQRIHEIALGRSLNKDSFRRRMLASGQLAPAGRVRDTEAHRPAALYRYQPATVPEVRK
jgi:8-oxo-dGTP diphosphatase